MMELTGQVAAVIGAPRTLGKEIGLCFARACANIVIADMLQPERNF
jgi:NAD(P)-dependent dehydrogenase (short-subunit alcohol dehydrogenase family)